MKNQKKSHPGVPQVAVIGAGYWGKNHVRNFSALHALAAVCDSGKEARARYAKEYPDVRNTGSFAEILQDKSIAGVVIATPAETHAELVAQALSAGKDVLVEKPLCLSVPEGKKLVALAAQHNRILMVGHLLWYHPAVLKLQELVSGGKLGRIRYIYSNRLNMGKIRNEENILWSFAPHDISVILGLLREVPDGVQAQGGSYLHPSIPDVTVSTFSFPSGVQAHIFVSWLHPFKEQKLVIVGDKQMAVFDDMEMTDKLVLYPHTVEWKERVPVAHKAEGKPVPLDTGEPLRGECQHFLDCIRTRKNPRTDGAEGLAVLSVLARCQDALDQKTDKPLAVAPKLPYKAHESAFIDKDVTIGEGTVIWHVTHVLKGSQIGERCKIGQNVVIGPNVKIGNNVKIQNNVSVYEGVTLEDHVFCGPSMVFTNVFNPRSEIVRMDEVRPTLVKRGASFGANCTVLCGITVGRYSFVGAGALVTHDVPDHALVHGSPARIRGWMCACGVKLDFKKNAAACKCGKRYQKTGNTVSPKR